MLIFLFFIPLGTGIPVENDDHAKLLEMDRDMQMIKSKLTVMETENQKLQSKVNVLEKVMAQPTIAFLAALGKDLKQPAIGHQIVFDVVHLNKGNAYNNNHGTFVAPVNGTYHFALELSFPPTSPNAMRATHVVLRKGSVSLCYIYSDGIFPNWIKRSATVLVDLLAGEDVVPYVEHITGVQDIAGSYFHSTFSGFLVK